MFESACVTVSPSEPPRSALPAELPLAALEDEIATLAAHIHAATARLLALIAEFDRRERWGAQGFRSCAHWLSWRIGLELGAAREHVRVARALDSLPRIRESFERGELSYSKVRAVTRIARPETEDDLLEMARAGTASQIEKMVRCYRRASLVDEREQAWRQDEGRYLRAFFDTDGMLVIDGRLPPEQGALVMKALEAATATLRAMRAPAKGGEDGTDVSAGRTSADAHGTVRRDTVVSRVPAGSGRSFAQEQADALTLMADRSLGGSAASRSGGERCQVVVHVDAEVLEDPAADGRSELEDGPRVPAETTRRLACDATVAELVHGPDGEVRPGRRRRLISAPLRRALRERDGGTCVFPGCANRIVDAHHVEHWAAGGETVLGNLASLCRSCHRLVHEAGWRMEARPEGGFRFFSPAGHELRPVPEAPALGPDPVGALVAEHAASGIKITPETGFPSWDGTPVDYDLGVTALLRASAAGRTWRGGAGLLSLGLLALALLALALAARRRLTRRAASPRSRSAGR